jgi:general secretion pathway protein H
VTLRAGSNSRGFSLFELLLVLVVLGFSAAVVVPAIGRGLRNREARQVALGFAAAARELGNKARLLGVPQALLVDRARNSYQWARDSEVALSPNLYFAAVEGGEMLESGRRRFSFYPNGASFGGHVVISAGADGASYLVRFHALTGRVEVQSGVGG